MFFTCVRAQLALSGGLTTGVTVQKVVEAEAMVAAGVMDVLVTNEVVAPTKLARLVALARRGATVGVLVDDVGAARALSDATARGGDGSIGGRATVSVLIEVDVGHHRCGVADPAAAVALGALVSSLPGLVLRGIQAYHGSAQHVRDPAERRAVATRAAAAAAAARDALLAAGLCCDVVTGGGTGTFAADAASGVCVCGRARVCRASECAHLRIPGCAATRNCSRDRTCLGTRTTRGMGATRPLRGAAATPTARVSAGCTRSRRRSSCSRRS